MKRAHETKWVHGEYLPFGAVFVFPCAVRVQREDKTDGKSMTDEIVCLDSVKRFKRLDASLQSIGPTFVLSQALRRTELLPLTKRPIRYTVDVLVYCTFFG